MDCQIKINLAQCRCTYSPCPRKGRCCECVAYHRAQGEMPGCLFPPEAEKTFDRSIEAFVRAHTRVAKKAGLS